MFPLSSLGISQRKEDKISVENRGHGSRCRVGEVWDAEFSSRFKPPPGGFGVPFGTLRRRMRDEVALYRSSLWTDEVIRALARDRNQHNVRERG